jgi:hypothetical protein
MIKQIFILMMIMFVGVNIVGVNAIDKSLGLNSDQITKLESQGIKDIKIVDYPCQKGMKCYSLDGDIKEKLIEIPLRVQDNCITTPKIVRINDKYVTQRTCSGVYNMRDITQEEINIVLERAVSKKVSDKIGKVDEYYPVKEDVTVNEQEISIGKSIGEWVSKKIKLLGELIG